VSLISSTWERTYYGEEERFTDEIKITDVGGTFVTIDELTPNQNVVVALYPRECTKLVLTHLELAALPQRSDLQKRSRIDSQVA
jgi:hypothetical protein